MKRWQDEQGKLCDVVIKQLIDMYGEEEVLNKFKSVVCESGISSRFIYEFKRNVKIERVFCITVNEPTVSKEEIKKLLDSVSSGSTINCVLDVVNEPLCSQDHYFENKQKLWPNRALTIHSYHVDSNGKCSVITNDGDVIEMVDTHKNKDGFWGKDCNGKVYLLEVYVTDGLDWF